MQLDSIARELQDRIGRDSVLTAEADRIAHSFDGTFAEGLPDLVVVPTSTERVSQVLAVACREVACERAHEVERAGLGADGAAAVGDDVRFEEGLAPVWRRHATFAGAVAAAVEAWGQRGALAYGSMSQRLTGRETAG